MNNSLGVSFSQSASVSTAWVGLEQEYKNDHTTGINGYDVNQMLARVFAGSSSKTYIDDNCSYIKVRDGLLYVDLYFYVWPSSLDLPYSLSTNLGEISTAEYTEMFKSFDVIFEGTSLVSLDFLFQGEVVLSTPVITSDGALLEDVVFEVRDNTIFTDREVYCVLRAEGVAKGFGHTVSMEFEKSSYSPALAYKVDTWSSAGLQYDRQGFPLIFNSGVKEGAYRIEFHNPSQFSVLLDGAYVLSGSVNQDLVTDWFTLKKEGWKSVAGDGSYLIFAIGEAGEEVVREGYAISSLQNEIIATWEDEGAQSAIMSLEIPACVDSLLSSCSDGSVYYTVNLNGYEEILNVYYSTCDGEVVLARWEPNE